MYKKVINRVAYRFLQHVITQHVITQQHLTIAESESQFDQRILLISTEKLKFYLPSKREITYI